MRKLLNEELDRLTVEKFKEAEKLPIVIVLDNVRSMHNVGSAFRTADAFLVEKVIICGITAKPPHREIHKTALGATDSVSWEYFDHSIDAITQLQKRHYQVTAVEQADKSTFLQDFDVNPGDKIALVFGNEIHGVSEDIVKMSDRVLEIPQFGTKHSINISVSIGIVVWQMVTKLKFRK